MKSKLKGLRMRKIRSVQVKERARQSRTAVARSNRVKRKASLPLSPS